MPATHSDLLASRCKVANSLITLYSLPLLRITNQKEGILYA